VERGGCAAALRAAGVTARDRTAWADEMRLGLRGQVRRVWAPRGVQVRQRVELRYEWRYLALAVDGPAGALWWTWLPNRRKESVAPGGRTWQAAGLAALVWDGAPSHRAALVRAVGMKLITQPPASPEVTPAERLFEELRRAVEGRMDHDREAKVAVVERERTSRAADPDRVRRLAGWPWVRDALRQRLPPYTAES
jgi:hypothetical protein